MKKAFKKVLASLFIACAVVGIGGLASATTVYAQEMRDPFSIERDFNWYLNQRDTGEDSYINCGPAVATMAALWYTNGAVNFTIEDTRNTVPYLRNQWWSDRHVFDFLRTTANASVDWTYAFNVFDTIQWLNEGRIVIVVLDASVITFGRDVRGMNRFYENVTGHFIIIKGYTVLDGRIYFITYDPFTMYCYYDDGWPMGRDRLFYAYEVFRSVRDWGQEWAIIVNNPGQSTTQIGSIHQ